MKRDMELIRELMLAIESQDGDFNYESVKTIGYDEPQIEYNLNLLIKAKLVVGEIHQFQGDPLQGGFSSIPVVELSWEGHEFLENTRNESVWKIVKEKAENVAIGVLTQVAAAETKRLFGLS